jgi:hypothetical protein
MRSLLSAATFGLLAFPLPHAIDLDRRQIADLGGSQPDPAATTATKGEPYDDKGRVRRRAPSGGPHRP